MDPRKNPFAPGAGTIPPELAGRNDLIEKASISLDRYRNGLSSRGLLFVGLRGVGKTVLLTRLSQNAEAEGFIVIAVETPERRSLPALLIPNLRMALMKMDRGASVSEAGKRVFRALGSFVSAMKLKYHDIEFAVDLGIEPGISDSGDLENDLMALFMEIGLLVKEKKTALVLFMDEIQYVQEEQFAALIMALHKCGQKQLPIALIGAGLPQLVGQAGRAKSYAERLFEYPELGALSEEAARVAIEVPANKVSVEFENKAIEEILRQTQCFPYFLQEWGKHSWNSARQSPITCEDVRTATQLAIAELDTNFFRVRFDRLTPSEKRYLRTMAELKEGCSRSGDIAQLLDKDVQSVAPVRANLIKKGMIFSPSHGENKFTVPLFEGYMKRVMPNLRK